MNPPPAIRICRLAAGWALAPGVFLLIGYYTSQLAAGSSGPREILHAVEGGLLAGLAVGVFLAGFYTSLAIRDHLPLTGLQMALIAGGWLLALFAGGLTVTLVNRLSTMLSRSWFKDLYPLVVYITLTLTGGLAAGAVGSFVTAKVIQRHLPELGRQFLGSMILRWWLGFALGGLLGGAFIIYGLIAYFLVGATNRPEGALAFAAGVAIVGLCGALTGGRYMLKQLAEFAGTEESGLAA